jgi:spore coat polysaccharide biosynthesis protein SpsF (cytidylyltransferase family)
MKAIIIQARTGSTRLPGKVLANFYNGQSILEIIIKRCKELNAAWPVIVATSTAEADKAILEVATSCGVNNFAGDEQDVLKRFIDAAEQFGARQLIRVCADNPFLDASLLKELLQFAEQPDVDYASYEVAPGVPAIKSHWGIFAEYVTLEALRKVNELTQESFYHEHVTNYCYGNPDHFKCAWIKAPDAIYNQTGFRFTVDTLQDFEIAQEMYGILQMEGKSCNFKELIALVSCNEKYQASMRTQIEQQTK